MTDIVSRNNRSKIMSSVRSKNNKSTEVRFRMILTRARIRCWRIHPNNIIGKPDFIFQKIKLCIFIDGCFWHGCKLCYRRPHTSRKYWDNKVSSNIIRDKNINRLLRKNGWKVLRIWEHELVNPSKVVKKVKIGLSNN